MAITVSTRAFHPYYHHGLNPNVQTEDVWGDAQYSFYTNSLACRSNRVYEVAKKNPNKRILLLGDSFTEGLGVDYDSTFAGLFQAELPSTEIINAAVASYSPKLYYLKLKYFIEQGFLFDEVIVFIDISDIQDEVLYEDFQPEYTNASLTTNRIKTKCQSYLSKNSFVYNIYSQTRIKKEKEKQTKELESDSLKIYIKNHYYEERAAWTYNDTIYNHWGIKGIKLAQENMQLLVDLCKINHIKLYIAVYPWPEQVKRSEQDSKQLQIWKNFSDINQLPFLNLFPCFRDADALNLFIKNDSHWNKKGHKVIADSLFNFYRLESSL